MKTFSLFVNQNAYACRYLCLVVRLVHKNDINLLPNLHVMFSMRTCAQLLWICMYLCVRGVRGVRCVPRLPMF